MGPFFSWGVGVCMYFHIGGFIFFCLRESFLRRMDMRKTGGFQIMAKDNYFFPADAGMIEGVLIQVDFHRK